MEITSGSSTRGLEQKYISHSPLVSGSSNYSTYGFVYDRPSTINGNSFGGFSSSTNRNVLPIPSIPSSSQIYYIMRAFVSGNIVYWSSVNSIDSVGTYSGYTPNSLSFITFVGTKEL